MLETPPTGLTCSLNPLPIPSAPSPPTLAQPSHVEVLEVVLELRSLRPSLTVRPVDAEQFFVAEPEEEEEEEEGGEGEKEEEDWGQGLGGVGREGQGAEAVLPAL